MKKEELLTTRVITMFLPGKKINLSLKPTAPRHTYVEEPEHINSRRGMLSQTLRCDHFGLFVASGHGLMHFLNRADEMT